MWDKANAVRPGMITVNGTRAMVTQYNAIVMASSPVLGIGAHDMEITSNDKYFFLLLCQPDWISIIVHSKLPEDQQCTWPTRRRYTEADMEALELWKRRLKAQMILLEEGVLEHWTSGRIVLAGDSVHKVTPNSALGGNAAMEDAVVITNTLQSWGVLTRQQAYDRWKAYITQRWLTPIIGLDSLAKKFAGLCITAPKLNFVEFDERRGILGWQDTMEVEKKRAMKGKVVEKGKYYRLIFD
ncbi:FAD binding domain-containing protein [Fusarium mexicanum]|uniref:FAD binding domain-containing protein n=1 Tax=Fusarium mexicanum TaxID=751941 RepID=A0A8H5MU91_9HYPO|nr:FAD binding domain-containing protein [Fusarium mexicanum]